MTCPQLELAPLELCFRSQDLIPWPPPTGRRHQPATSKLLQRNLRVPLVVVDPGDEGANASVDTRVVSLRTAVTPGDETLQHLRVVDNGAARVARARVLATFV